MRTDKQREASRRNGAKSRGPVTPEGKRIASMNAKRRSLLCRTVLLEGESPAHFEALIARLIDEYDPWPGTESDLIESMATWQWRKLRLIGLENAIVSHEIRNHREMTSGESLNNITHAAYAMRNLTDNSRMLEYLAAGQVSCEVQYARCLRQLKRSIAGRAKILRPIGPGIPPPQDANSLETQSKISPGPRRRPPNEPENEPDTNP